jgi:hypothetical protein
MNTIDSYLFGALVGGFIYILLHHVLGVLA